VAATYDPASGVKSIYLDGVLIGTENRTPGTAVLGGGAAAFTGSLGGSSGPFDGPLDEVAIYGPPTQDGSPTRPAEFVQPG